jgi:putative peptidoglycan lipid II flippase
VSGGRIFVLMSRPGDFDETVVLNTTSPGDPNSTVVLPQAPATPAPFDDTVVLPASPITAASAPATETERAGQAQPESGSVARNSAVMAVGSIISRMTGLLRVAAIGAALGATFVNDDYQLAIALPNMMFELLVGGVLASVIVPTLVRRRKHDEDGGQAYAQRLLSLAAIALGIAAALATVAAPLFTMLLAASDSSDADKSLITRLAYLILPAVFFYGMAALFGALLNSRGHFAAPMFTPILNNLVVIATAGAFIVITADQDVTPGTVTAGQLLVLGLGTTAGIVVQTVGLIPALRRVGFRWRWRFDFRRLGLGELGRLSVWMLLFVVVSQVGVLVVLKIAKEVGGEDSAGPAIFQNAFLMFMMAHGIVAVSVLTALMPRLSAAAADNRTTDLIAQLNSGLRLVSVVLIPITAAYVVLGRPIAVTLFNWGNFDHAAALRTAPVIALAGLGLVPYAIMQLQQFAFYALRDTRTPAVLNVPVVALRVGLDLLFLWVLPATVVVTAMMGASGLSFVFGALVSIALLRRRLGHLGLRRVASALVKLAGAAAIAAVPAYLVVYGLTRLIGDEKLASLVQLALGGAVLIGLYYALALVFRVAEVRDLTRMVRARLGR